MNVAFGTKAETLQMLQSRGLNVPDMYYFNVMQWLTDKALILEGVRLRFGTGDRQIIVRSSARNEDNEHSSMAGAFHSVLGVDPENADSLKAAITRVIDSYDNDPGNQILIQPMVDDIEVSGVIMTRCLEDGSPYYAINYDDESGRTDSVTGGTGASKTVFVYRGVQEQDFDSPRLAAMVQFARGLESLFGGIPVDIEFGMNKSGVMHVFQVRRICSVTRWDPQVESNVSKVIHHVEHFVRQYGSRRAGLFGSSTIFGSMPDWNPAEIIGVAPRSLSASLYRDLVTHSIWRKARAAMGYRPMPSEELMVLIAGRPFIDVRNSFNSFLPQGVVDDTAEALVNAWLARLDAHPELHDKVEFEIVPTVYDPCFDDHFAERYRGLLGKAALAHYKGRLQELTCTNLSLAPSGSLLSALSSLRCLRQRQRARGAADFHGKDVFETLAAVRGLLHECRTLGTLAFSIVARHAFIAEAFLRSAVRLGALSQERLALFKRTIKTVSGRLSEDFAMTAKGAMSLQDFINIYGHLRPGTYDILSPRYADRPDLFDNATVPEVTGEIALQFELSSRERDQLANLFKAYGADWLGPDELLAYSRLAIAGRENLKFVFTRNLSDAIEGLAAWGLLVGLDRETISHLCVSDILGVLSQPLTTDAREYFEHLADLGRRQNQLARSFRLSHLIRSPRDIYIVPQHRSLPNFITTSRIEAKVCVISANSQEFRQNLTGKVVCIENADPGFDWIFTKGIAGLVTKYGGTNSHMAIRCAEYGIPAAIGCGEQLYEQVASALKAELDAGQKTLKGLGCPAKDMTWSRFA